MEMLEVWQIQLSLFLFMSFTNWFGYLFLSYWTFDARPKYLWKSLSIPLITTAVLYYLTGLPDSSVGVDTLNILMTILSSIIAYGVFFLMEEEHTRKNRTEKSETSHSRYYWWLVCSFLFVLAFLQLLSLTAYAKNISEISFQKESATVNFPQLLCNPKSINTFVVGNEMAYQIWPNYSSFRAIDKPLVIEISSGGGTDQILSKAKWDINRKHAGFPLLLFECDEHYEVHDKWILIKAKSLTFRQNP